VEAVVRLVVVSAAVAVLGCGGDERARRERGAQVAACADAVERAAAAPPGDQVEAIARGCPAACGGLADWLAARAATRLRPGVESYAPGIATLAALLGGCQPRCDASAVAQVPASTRWVTLADSCGTDPLGLPRDHLHFASEEWLALTEVARWIERSLRAGVADSQVPGRVEHVTSTSRFALPAPAYPDVPATRFRMTSRARQFIVVGDDLRLGTMPHVRLRGGRLEALAVPGAHPGQRVALDQLGAAYAEHSALLSQQVSGGDAGPLVIAPASTSLARVLDLITRLGVGHAELAVAGDVAYAHPVLLERRDKAVAAPEIHLQPTGISIRGFGDDRDTDWDRLDAELDHFAAVNAPVRAVELVAHPAATLADLARLLDACVEARISAVIFAPVAY
jgi:hypothetical protein